MWITFKKKTSPLKTTSDHVIQDVITDIVTYNQKYIVQRLQPINETWPLTYSVPTGICQLADNCFLKRSIRHFGFNHCSNLQQGAAQGYLEARTQKIEKNTLILPASQIYFLRLSLAKCCCESLVTVQVSKVLQQDG